MNFLKSLAKGFFWLLILCLLVAPLALIYEISAREMEQYATPTAPVFHETAYGALAQAKRMDLQDYIIVSGVFQSDTYEYMELTQQEPAKIRWAVGVGDEVLVGQILGTYSGRGIVSTVEGLVTEINVYNDSYLKVRTFAPVVLEIQVDQKTANALNRADSLTTEDGVAVTVVYTARIPDANGMIAMKLSFDDAYYTLGYRVKEERLYTGTSYLQVLVLPESCLYQKVAGEDEPWYVRQVSADGYLIGEHQVSRGYSNGEYCSITGINEGEYFDTGYKALAG